MKKIQDTTILEINWLNPDNYVITVGFDTGIEKVEAGNFAEIKVPDSPDVFLRRPISIMDVDYNKKTMSFYIKAIGKGTIKIGNLDIGSKLNLVYPLGNSFSEKENSKVLFIGGGSGIAPFKLLGEKLTQLGNEVTYLLGARTKEDIFLTEEFGKYGSVEVTTEDGSMGEKGLVTQHSIFENVKQFDFIYTCGPDPMMKAVANIAEHNNIDCEASLENMMACGIGACLCCVTPTIRGNECVCTEGPVFNSKELKW